MDYGTMALSVGGGVEGFSDSELRDSTEVGGGWDVRAQFSTRSALSLEVAYVGAAQSVDALGVDPDALLVSNGVEADLRVNFLQHAVVQPYVFGGLGWRRYDLTNTDTNFSDLEDQDDVVEIPFGVGLALRAGGGFLIDVRGQFRAAFDNDLTATRGGDTNLHRWGATANLGVEF